MSSDRLRAQLLFENILSGGNITKWQSLTKSQIKNFAFTPSHVIIFESALLAASLDFFYKGVLSINEGIISAKHKNFSWATVKLYYATYYFLRASLCCNKIAFVRKEKDGYHFENIPEDKPKRNSKPDHIAAVDLFKLHFSTSDFLQSNTINCINAYDWLRQQRENVNYKHRTFFEPDISNIWDSISTEFDNDGIEFWIRKYIDEDIYAFLDDHAIIALPIKRLILTHSDLRTTGCKTIISADKMTKLDSLISQDNFLKYLKPFYRG